MNLTSKLALVYILAGFLPVLIILAVNFFEMRSMFREEDRAKNDVYLDRISELIDNEFEKGNIIADYIVDDEGSCERAAEAAELLNSITGNAIKLYVNDENPEDTEYLDGLSSVKNTEWYDKVAMGSENTWHMAYDGGKMIFLKKAESRRGRKLLGIIRTETDIGKLIANAANSSVHNYGIKITDAAGKMIYEYDSFDEKNRKYIVTAEELAKLDEDDYTVLGTVMNSTGWKMWMYQPVNIMISKITPVNLITITGIVTCMIAAFFCIRFNAVFVTGRIKKLQQITDSVEQGNFAVEITNNNDDEIGLLVDSFSKMIARLNYLINEVYQSKIKEKEYEMTALQAQINPHFLYNTLSMINWKAIAAEQPDISRITLALSAFYRTSLNKGKNETDIKGEMENIRSYLDIQLMLHDDGFDLVMDVDEETLQYKIPNLILQPLVENAIEHGIDVMTDGRGLLTVRCKNGGDVIKLSVEDNGVGMTEKQAESILTGESKGYGVRNVNERIKLYYGAEYGIKVTGAPGAGTNVLIIIPKKPYI